MMRTPLTTWFPDAAALGRFRRGVLGRAPVVLEPRDEAWRALAPGFGVVQDLVEAGSPFQVVADRRHVRRPDPPRARRALAAGGTLLFPQAHQVLPRLARLMVALRAGLLGPFREECSYLFFSRGTGREGMGLHHDGEVDSFWLQLEGRRTVLIGPPVPPGTEEEIPRAPAGRAGWRAVLLAPGSLFYLPPRTPHRVVYRERAQAVSLTWGALDPVAVAAGLLARGPRPPAAGARTLAGWRRLAARAARRCARAAAGPALARVHAEALAAWDVVAGQADAVPPEIAGRMWAQVPAVAGPVRRGVVPLWLGGGDEIRVPASLRSLAASLAMMPVWSVGGGGARAGLDQLAGLGLVAPRDLPRRIVPADPAGLDGWRFA